MCIAADSEGIAFKLKRLERKIILWLSLCKSYFPVGVKKMFKYHVMPSDSL